MNPEAGDGRSLASGQGAPGRRILRVGRAAHTTEDVVPEFVRKGSPSASGSPFPSGETRDANGSRSAGPNRPSPI